MSENIQGSKAWLEMRKKHIGASEIPIIMGNSPWKTPYVLWLEKTRKKENDKPNQAMLRGQLMEEEARRVYSEIYKISVLPSVNISNEWDIGMASLDGISQDGEVIVEIKCPMNFKLYNDANQNIIPQHYLDQIQWQLWVTKAKRCDFFVYISEEKNELVQVFPDVEYQKTMLEKAKKFWKLVESDTSPDIDKDDSEYINNDLANHLALEWRRLKEAEEELKGRRAKIEVELQNSFKDKKCYFPDAQVKLNWIKKKGLVDWKEVQHKWCISQEDVEKYRKKSFVCSTLKVVN